MLEPARNDVGNEFAAVHAIAELQFVVVAGDGLDAAEIRIDRRENLGRHQIALVDQRLDLWGLDQDLEHATETAVIAPAGRGGHTEKDRVGILIYDRPIAARDDVMRLVDDDELGRRQRHRLRPDGTAMQCLYRTDLGRAHWARVDAGLHDAISVRGTAVRDAVRLKLVAGLPDDLPPVRDDDDALALVDRPLDDRRHDHGLAGGGGRHQQDAALAGGELALELGDRVDLVRTKLGHD